MKLLKNALLGSATIVVVGSIVVGSANAQSAPIGVTGSYGSQVNSQLTYQQQKVETGTLRALQLLRGNYVEQAPCPGCTTPNTTPLTRVTNGFDVLQNGTYNNTTLLQRVDTGTSFVQGTINQPCPLCLPSKLPTAQSVIFSPLPTSTGGVTVFTPLQFNSFNRAGNGQ